MSQTTKSTDYSKKKLTTSLENNLKYKALTKCGFKLKQNLGSGSYAVVKAGYYVPCNKEIAIKIISKRRAPIDYLEKFLPRELRVVGALRHPNIVTFYQAIETEKKTYLIMERANKGDLLHEIRQSRFVREPQSAIWFWQLLDGMDYCHSRKVAHRDIKCENLLLDDKRNIKITDFGFARAEVDKKTTLSETYCGSYAYAPPEILIGQPYKPLTADVWSMGVVLYIMVIGRLPFDDTCHQTLLREVKRGPRFPEKRGDCKADCKELITQILVNHDMRPTVLELKRDKWFRRQIPIIKASLKAKTKT
ncbi:DgyrCDS12893 [Dimorphilus gyrociliatus]|uniref:DgyrCDS12893 n=1 Tax=Dimorphilus gyrociliatus TaxID=2664684 RepID=A0A7I8W933_9ANNE|nr:DgyrCDS12893 [Dimorphilus gyrociliatus]